MVSDTQILNMTENNNAFEDLTAADIVSWALERTSGEDICGANDRKFVGPRRAEKWRGDREACCAADLSRGIALWSSHARRRLVWGEPV